MACIPISFPPSAPMPKLEPSSRLPDLGSYPTYRSSPNGVHKKNHFASLPYRPKGSIAHLPPSEQITQLRQSRKAIKGKLYGRIARLQRELDVLQREYYADPTDDCTPLARAPRFWPEDHAARPRDLFAHDAQPQGSYHYTRDDRRPPPRMTRFDAPNDEILLYTSASCLDQHTASGTRSAASACVFGPAGLQPRSVALRLERRGPTGQEHPQEANRAHLRAAIAALQCRQWREEGWSAITIASDSEYLVEGVTNWIEIWQQNGWRTSKSTGNSYEGGMVANRDLWELLLRLLADHEQVGVEVRFWLILHELNLEAHAEARTAAEVLKEEENFCRVPYIEEMRSADNTRHVQESPFYTGFAMLPQ